MTEEKKMEGTAAVTTETEGPVLFVLSGNTTIRIGLHFSNESKESADDIIHRLIAEKVKHEEWE